MLLLSLTLAIQTGDTLILRAIPTPPAPNVRIDTVVLGRPTLRVPAGQGSALVWLLRAADTVFVAASIPDSTPYWGDDFVVSLDSRGDGEPKPQHDDFQWDFRRILDSSVVFRGVNGRWEPPRGDPDWRLGAERSGGGWEASGQNQPSGWSVLLRLDPAWFPAEADDLPRIAFRIYDDSPSGWYAWPSPPGNEPGSAVERSPARWGFARRAPD